MIFVILFVEAIPLMFFFFFKKMLNRLQCKINDKVKRSKRSRRVTDELFPLALEKQKNTKVKGRLELVFPPA